MRTEYRDKGPSVLSFSPPDPLSAPWIASRVTRATLVRPPIDQSTSTYCELVDLYAMAGEAQANQPLVDDHGNQSPYLSIMKSSDAVDHEAGGRDGLHASGMGVASLPRRACKRT